jgi:hypothetical protein
MELFANALLIVLIVLMLIAFMLMVIFTRANLEDRVKKARQIAAIINGQISKSSWQSRSGQASVEAIIVKGKWQDYDVKLILDPYFFQLTIFFPKLKKRGFWFISFPKVIDTNIVWGGRYLYSTLQYDDFFDKDDVLYQPEFNLALIKLEATAKQLSNIHEP